MPRDLSQEKVEVNVLVHDLRPLRNHHCSHPVGGSGRTAALWAIEHAAVRSVILEPLLNVHIKTIRNLVMVIRERKNQTQKGGTMSVFKCTSLTVLLRPTAS
jgi:hypothetical protein